MYILSAVLIGPVFALLLAWVGATVYRLYNPEHPLPFEEDPVMHRERARSEGRAVPVGVREIREDQRRACRQRAKEYHYAWGVSDGIPADWRDELWQRRN